MVIAVIDNDNKEDSKKDDENVTIIIQLMNVIMLTIVFILFEE